MVVQACLIERYFVPTLSKNGGKKSKGLLLILNRTARGKQTEQGFWPTFGISGIYAWHASSLGSPHLMFALLAPTQ